MWMWLWHRGRPAGSQSLHRCEQDRGPNRGNVGQIEATCGATQRTIEATTDVVDVDAVEAVDVDAVDVVDVDAVYPVGAVDVEGGRGTGVGVGLGWGGSGAGEECDDNVWSDGERESSDSEKRMDYSGYGTQVGGGGWWMRV